MDQENVNKLVSLILGGCKLARELEPNLSSLLAHRPGLVGEVCDDIVEIFGSAKTMLIGEAQARDGARDCHEWRRGGYTQAVDLIRTGVSENMGAGRAEFVVGGGSGRVQTSDVSDSGRNVVAPVSRKRKDDAEKRTTKVAAPRIGNTEVPPEDGNTWRKYGQKEILGSRFPRSYYRCTHQKLYQCPAKKQVQRLDDDPYTFEVTYRGDHTCHMSSTAPSAPPPAGADIAGQEMNPGSHSTGEALARWLSAAEGGGGASGSGRFGKEIEYPVADMADAMFNSGSSSSNSIDLIFTSMMEDKWDKTGPGDKKN